MRIKQVFVPYWEWEDYKNGMWRKLPKSQESEMLNKAIQFTGDWTRYGEAMGRVVKEWGRTMLNSLTNSSINKRAFLGHCACSLDFNCPEYITRMAWKELNDNQRLEADKVAQETIDNYLCELRLKSTSRHGKTDVIKSYQMMLL